MYQRSANRWAIFSREILTRSHRESQLMSRTHDVVLERLAMGTSAVRPRSGDRCRARSFGMEDLRELIPERRSKAGGSPSAKLNACRGIELTEHFRPGRKLASVHGRTCRAPAPGPCLAGI